MSKIVLVQSFGRAVGRTTLAANLSAMLALSGMRVGVLDLDFDAPSLHLFLGLPESEITCTLNSYLQNQCGLDDLIYDLSARLEIPLPGGLVLIPSTNSAGEVLRHQKDAYNLESLAQLITYLDENCRLDYLVLDTTAGLTEDTLYEAALSDVLLVVLRPDRHDFQGTAVSVDVARKLGVPKLMLVLNNAPESLDDTQAGEELAGCYECEVGAILPNSEQLLALASSRLMVLEHPDSEYTRRLHQLAARLAG